MRKSLDRGKPARKGRADAMYSGGENGSCGVPVPACTDLASEDAIARTAKKRKRSNCRNGAESIDRGP